VFRTLRDNELSVKKEKYSLPLSYKKRCLSWVTSLEKVCMDPKKVKVILKWEPPTKVTELRSFLGLVNYYQGLFYN